MEARGSHRPRDLRFKGKKAAAFGCSGWSGEAPKKISEMLGKSGFEIVADNLACMWEPGDKALAMAREYGRAFVPILWQRAGGSRNEGDY